MQAFLYTQLLHQIYPNCEEGFIGIDEYCYYQSDLDVLQIFIDNSHETINMDMDDNGNGVIEPLELGSKQWNFGRLHETKTKYTLLIF